MPITVTVAPSPMRQKRLRAPESQYLVSLAAQIAEDQPHATVLAQYGQDHGEIMVMRGPDQDDVELF